MAKSYKNVFLKKNRVYSVEQLMIAYGVTANMVSNWVKEGLIPSDAQKPYVFRGAVVVAFHKHQRSLKGRKLLPAEFWCRTCQASVEPGPEAVTKIRAANGRPMLQAACPVCSSKVQKITHEADCDSCQDCRNPNIPMDCCREEKTDLCGGIWINVGNQSAIYSSENDRIIHKWQSYAGRYDEKTIVKHLAAIRYFEQFLSGKSFRKLRIEDFAAVRDDLKRRANVTSDDRMAASSIKHTISYLGSFFDWLICQKGCRRLPGDFRGYLVVPKAILAKSAQTKQKDFPSIEEAEQLLLDMPADSLVEMRSRAIFALAFLGALRADTLASLQLQHVQIAQRLIIQDGGASRTKAGKSITIFWFPIAKTFEEIVVAWIEHLRMLGLQDTDALFPDTKWLKHKIDLVKQIPVMSTTYAVADAFKVASRDLTVPYTPHAAKHTIGAERDARPLTQQERKAWSLNMGHETEQITERHYGTMPEDQRFEVLENIGTDRASDVPQMTDEDKIAFYDAVVEKIGFGKPR
jgi:site-specific recombinase XerC